MGMVLLLVSWAYTQIFCHSGEEVGDVWKTGRRSSLER